MSLSSKFEEHYQIAKENEIVVEFDFSYFTVTIDTTLYKTKITVSDRYLEESRSYKLVRNTSIDDVIQEEVDILSRIEIAKKLEYTEEINRWQQVETKECTFIKFVSVGKSLEISLSSSDEWQLNNNVKDSIKVAKYDMVKRLQERDPIVEAFEETVRETLNKELQKVDGVGPVISRKMANKTLRKSSGLIESFEDIRGIYRPQNVSRSLPSKAKHHFKDLSYDPIEKAVTEKKKELVEEYDQYQLVAQEI